MNREIKYRAWDGEKFHYYTSLSGLYGVLNPIEQQFTGLHDKNGKEIYEGDILELVGGTCNFLPCGIYNDQRYGIGDKMIVQKLKSGFTLCGMNMYDCDIPNRVGKVDNYTFWNHQSSLKIIGNIYKNPELL